MSMPTHDRVRANTALEVNQWLDAAAHRRIERYTRSSAKEMTRRIAELDREWDIEPVLELNASVLAFSGLCLGATKNRKWLVLPGLVLPFLFQHAVQGWCPPLPLLRRLGVRTRTEIDHEKGADVAKRAQRGRRLANDLPTKESDACPNPAALAGTFRRGHYGASRRPVGRGAGTNYRGLFSAAPSISCQYAREFSAVW